MGKLEGTTPKKREEPTGLLKVRKGGIGAKPRASSGGDAATYVPLHAAKTLSGTPLAVVAPRRRVAIEASHRRTD